MLSTDQAAKKLKVHPSRIKVWVEQGRLPFIRIGARGRLRFPDDITRPRAYQAGRPVEGQERPFAKRRRKKARKVRAKS